jgi:NAD(P)-dependent dehydrogenase (short-subunit alcohol dehydrogenase family)
MRNLQGKVVVITGAGSGIGRALALQFAAEGSRLALCDINPVGLAQTVGMIDNNRDSVFTKAFDVGTLSDFQSFAADVIRNFGHVDVVINNAGKTLMQQSIEKSTYMEFEDVLAVNLMGVIYGTREFLPHLKERPEAAIVNIASIFSTAAYPYQAPYSTSKYAVRGFTEALRQETARSKVAVQVVMPGGIKTNIVHNIETNDPVSRNKFAARFDKSAITSADEAARQIIKGIKQKQPRILIGRDARLMDLVVRLFPDTYEKILKKLF